MVIGMNQTNGEKKVKLMRSKHLSVVCFNIVKKSFQVRTSPLPAPLLDLRSLYRY